MNTSKSTIIADRTFKLQAYTIIAMARLYGVNRRTFKSWLQPFLAEIGERHGYYYTTRQVSVIIEKIGLPSEIPLNED